MRLGRRISDRFAGSFADCLHRQMGLSDLESSRDGSGTYNCHRRANERSLVSALERRSNLVLVLVLLLLLLLIFLFPSPPLPPPPRPLHPPLSKTLVGLPSLARELVRPRQRSSSFAQQSFVGSLPLLPPCRSLPL